MVPEIYIEYDVIIVDTSIFEANGLRLEKGLLGKLAQFKNGPVDFVFPDVVLNEVLAHLEKKITSSRHTLSKAINVAGDHLFFDGSALNDAKKVLLESEEVKNLAQCRIDNFVKATGAIVLDSNEYVSVSSLIRKYFANEPPFAESGKKKSEFPDAIILMAVEQWAKNLGKSVLAIARDKDWEAYCELTDIIDYESDLGEGLALFHQANAAYEIMDRMSEAIINNKAECFKSQIEEHLRMEIEELTPDQEAESEFYWEPDVIAIHYKNYEFIINDNKKAEFRIIDVSDEEIILEAKVWVSIDAEGTFSLSVHDSIDKDYVYMGAATVLKDEEFMTELLITLSGKINGSIDELSVHQVEVLDVPSCIDFGTIVPDWE